MFVRRGVDAGGQSQHHVGAQVELISKLLHAMQLGQRVHHDTPNILLIAVWSSSSDLLLPCKPIFAGSVPARRAMASSPPEAVSINRPSSLTHWATCTVKRALEA